MNNNFEKKVIVHKAITDNKHFYFTSNIEAFSEVIKNLHSIGAIKLFLYLSKNQNKYSLTLTEDEFCNWANEDNEAFNSGFDELIKNGYLIESLDSEDNSCNIYNFYDYNAERTDLEIKDTKKYRNDNFINMTVYDIKLHT